MTRRNELLELATGVRAAGRGRRGCRSTRSRESATSAPLSAKPTPGVPVWAAWSAETIASPAVPAANAAAPSASTRPAGSRGGEAAAPAPGKVAEQQHQPDQPGEDAQHDRVVCGLLDRRACARRTRFARRRTSVRPQVHHQGDEPADAHRDEPAAGQEQRGAQRLEHEGRTTIDGTWRARSASPARTGARLRSRPAVATCRRCAVRPPSRAGGHRPRPAAGAWCARRHAFGAGVRRGSPRSGSRSCDHRLHVRDVAAATLVAGLRIPCGRAR